MSLSSSDRYYSNAQIRKKLLENNYSDGWKPSSYLIDSIIQQFWFRDYMSSLISYSPYLEHLKSFLNKNKPTYFDRLNFYTFFFQELFNHDQLEILKKIGVVFELMQTDTLSVKDFRSLLKKLSDGQITITKLKQKKLIVNHESKDMLKWAHHSLTEFLTAQKILDSDDSIETTSELILLKHDGIKSIKPSWYGVIRFLLESESKLDFIEWLIKLSSANPEIIDEAFSDTITSISLVNNGQRFPANLQKKLFFLIYNNYKKNLLWLPVWTRNGLGNLLKKSYIDLLKPDLRKTRDETRNFVQRGNVVAIVGQALLEQANLFSASEKEYWKSKFIAYANDPNDNGVLQRHSLYALESYHDEPEITDEVAGNKDDPDSLIRGAFIQLCGKIAPNYTNAIGYVIDAMSAGSDINGRHALYKITGYEGISYLLQKFIDDDGFLEQFLDKDDIFNYKKEKADDVLINHIKNVANEDVIKKLKTIILKAYVTAKVRDNDRAYFLKQIALIVVNSDPNFYKEILHDISNVAEEKERLNKIFDYEHLFPLLLTPENVVDFSEKISNLHERGIRDAQLAIYSVKRNLGDVGNKIYEKALREEIIDPPKQIIERDYEQERKDSIYERFKDALQIDSNKYLPTVFGYYVQSEFLHQEISDSEKERLKDLAINSNLKKIDPKKFKVTYLDRKTRSGQYTITNLSTYFGDLIRLGLLLFSSELDNYKQKVIDFIPYAYSNDQKTILEVVKIITNDELRWVNDIYLDKKNDVRYLLPSSYSYLVREYSQRGCDLSDSIEVLKSFAIDPLITDHDREYALETLGELIDENDEETKKFLQELFGEYDDDVNKVISEKANELLIEVFRDKPSIEWRFERLRNNITAFKPPSIEKTHWVGKIEQEFLSTSFANPLIELKDQSLIDRFIELLDLSFKLIDEPEYSEYSKYLQKIVLSYVRSFTSMAGLQILVLFQNWLDENIEQSTSNWFEAQLKQTGIDLKNIAGSVNLQTALDRLEVTWP